MLTKRGREVFRVFIAFSGRKQEREKLKNFVQRSAKKMFISQKNAVCRANSVNSEGIEPRNSHKNLGLSVKTEAEKPQKHKERGVSVKN